MTEPGVPADTGVWELIAFDVILGIIAIVVVAALLVRASRYPGPARYIGPLAILSGIALVLGALAEQDALIAIGAGGVGALGAVLQTVVKKSEQDDDTP